MRKPDNNQSLDDLLARGLQAVAGQHAKYREQLLLWVKNKVLAHVDNITREPSSHNSVFRNPDSIKITIYLSFEEFLWFFDILGRDSDIPPIVGKDEITRIIGNAIRQQDYTVEVFFEDWWPNDAWFNILLTKQLNISL